MIGREQPERASKPVERGEADSSRDTEGRPDVAPKPRPVLRIAKLGHDLDESGGH